MIVRLVGVPFDGMGRNPGQAGAPAALRKAGFEAAFSRREIVLRPDLAVPGLARNVIPNRVCSTELPC